MSEPNEFTVAADVPIVVRDYGGDGPDVMLLHGGGGHLGNWEDFVPLIADFRVISVDLRCHGLSGDGPVTMDAFIADLEAVREHMSLDRFAVVGHSLGGMIAAHWAAKDNGPAAAISLDGHRASDTDPRHYRGLDHDDLLERLAALGAVFAAQTKTIDAPIPDELISVLGQRSIVQRDGNWHSRFTTATAEALRDQGWFLDSVPAIGRTRVPLLVLIATQNPPGMPETFIGLMDAYRCGLREDLAALAEDNPMVIAAEVDAGHGMITQAPGEMAAIVATFVGNAL